MRFDGFNKVWESKQIGEIAEVVGGGTPKTEIVDYWDGEIKWFTPSEIGKTKYVFDSDRHITEKGLKNSSAKLLPKDALLLSSRATVGEISIALTECSTNQGFQSLITKSNVDNDFIYYLISTIKNEFLRRSSGSTFLEINKNEIKRMPINIPELSEQKKISNLFSAIDNKIEMLEKKCEYYQDFKKYLMQRIFSSSDDKLRFNFTDEWEKYLLGDISLIGKGFTPSTSNPSFWDGDLKWLSIADMNQGKYINQTTKKITSDGSKNKEPVKKGTLLMSFKLSIGKLGILTEDMYTNEAICNFKWKNKDVLTEYMYYYLSSINILKYGSQAAKGITLNNETLSTIPVLLPSLEEQKKIINILSDVDMKINMLENSINDTLKFKKGLLQQMFVVRINWRCNFKLAKSPSFNKHLLILKNKIIFIIIK